MKIVKNAIVNHFFVHLLLIICSISFESCSLVQSSIGNLLTKSEIKKSKNKRSAELISDLRKSKVDSILTFYSGGFGLRTNHFTTVYWKKQKVGYSKTFFYQKVDDKLIPVESRIRKINWNSIIHKIDSVR